MKKTSKDFVQLKLDQYCTFGFGGNRVRNRFTLKTVC